MTACCLRAQSHVENIVGTASLKLRNEGLLTDGNQRQWPRWRRGHLQSRVPAADERRRAKSRDSAAVLRNCHLVPPVPRQS
jgi:hypothetical protein